ncbi:MAG TPA: DUF2442 domain-containing protein [Candidatus Elarobacter sp.]|nr:DUF2442 domain-containing protein [Candidatus Elarobacter sp.]
MAKTSRPTVIPPLTEAMYQRGLRAGNKKSPCDAVAARYDRAHDMLELTLRNGIVVRFPRKSIWEIARFTPSEIGRVEVQPGGEGISIRKLDVDISVAGLLADELGSLFSRALGARTRGISTPKKAAASRENGRKGGRPKRAA